MDLNKDSTVSIDELDKFGFTSSRDMLLYNHKNGYSVKKSEDDNINEFDYTKNKRTFTADQTAMIILVTQVVFIWPSTKTTIVVIILYYIK